MNHIGTGTIHALLRRDTDPEWGHRAMEDTASQDMQTLAAARRHRADVLQQISTSHELIRESRALIRQVDKLLARSLLNLPLPPPLLRSTWARLTGHTSPDTFIHAQLAKR